jgi:hypothetical protein
MYEVVIPASELNEFDLPPVCIVTGEREGVVFKPVTFAWYPRWMGLLALANLPIAIIVATATKRRVRGTLPFTQAAWFRWRCGQVLMSVAYVLAVALFMGGIVLSLSDDLDSWGLLSLGSSAALPLGVWWGLLRGRGPQVVSIDPDTIVLSIPHGVAAHALTQHFVAGLERSGLEDRNAAPRARCARHPGTAATWVCGRCGAFLCPLCEHRVRREARPLCPGCWTQRERSLAEAKAQERGLALANVALLVGCLAVVPLLYPVHAGALVLNTVSLVRNRHPDAPRGHRRKAFAGLLLTGVGLLLSLAMKLRDTFG